MRLLNKAQQTASQKERFNFLSSDMKKEFFGLTALHIW